MFMIAVISQECSFPNTGCVINCVVPSTAEKAAYSVHEVHKIQSLYCSLNFTRTGSVTAQQISKSADIADITSAGKREHI